MYRASKPLPAPNTQLKSYNWATGMKGDLLVSRSGSTKGESGNSKVKMAHHQISLACSCHVSCGSHYNAAYHYGELVNNISITVFLQKHTTLYSNTHNEHLLPSRARSTMGNQGNWPSIVDQSMHTCKYVVMMPIGVVASEELGLRGRGCRRGAALPHVTRPRSAADRSGSGHVG